MRFDGRLYLVTDRGLCLGRELIAVVEAAVAGGVTAVQLREKQCDTREFVALGRRLMQLLRPAGVPLFINDRVDVALACGADGIHVGQSDMTVVDVRQLAGSEVMVGLSVETMADIAEAEALPVDYLGIGPVYATATKKDACAPWRMEGLKKARTATKLPLVAIGSVNLENCAEVMACGMDGVAVVSALCSAEDVTETAREMRRRIN